MQQILNRCPSLALARHLDTKSTIPASKSSDRCLTNCGTVLEFALRQPQDLIALPFSS